MRYFFLSALVTLSFLTLGCRSATETAAYHIYETECLGQTADGRQTLRVWAAGKSAADAKQQALKKAVYDVTFSSITAGSGSCNAFPIIDMPNAHRQHEAYFDRFLADGGDYTRYVSVASNEKKSRKEFRSDEQRVVGLVVVVDRSALRSRYVEDHIIKPQ